MRLAFASARCSAQSERLHVYPLTCRAVPDGLTGVDVLDRRAPLNGSSRMTMVCGGHRGVTRPDPLTPVPFHRALAARDFVGGR